MAIPNFVTGTQDQIVDTVASVNEILGKVPTPDLAAYSFVERLPARQAVVERAFVVAQEILENQKQFTIRLLEATVRA